MANMPTITHVSMSGRQLRALRRQIGLTQARFAELLGVTSNTVARQERGEVRIRATQAALAERLVASFEQATKLAEITVIVRSARLGPITNRDPLPPRDTRQAKRRK